LIHLADFGEIIVNIFLEKVCQIDELVHIYSEHLKNNLLKVLAYFEYKHEYSLEREENQPNIADLCILQTPTITSLLLKNDKNHDKGTHKFQILYLSRFIIMYLYNKTVKVYHYGISCSLRTGQSAEAKPW
jgi:hypothetical protein